MRRHLQKFLPIVLIALMVQVLAPIGACWAAAITASDPLGLAAICHDSGAASGQQEGDQGGEHRAHDGACAICCVLHAGASADTPQVPTLATPYRHAARLVWRDQALGLSVFRTGSNARARAPPLSM
jgi:hypothetical protein